MDFTTIFIIGAVVLLAIFFLIIRLAIRWAIRMTIIGVILLALAGGGLFWWWTTRLAPALGKKPQRSTPTRRASSR